MSAPSPRPVLGLLHTSPVHVATFDTLLAQEDADVDVRHLVAEPLLSRVRVEGPAAVADAVRDAIAELDADVVLCTCSTIGGIAERVGGGTVLRVDRPMAAAAVAAQAGTGGPIVVLAALQSTVAPTLGLLGQEARAAGSTPSVQHHVVADAWDRFEAGDADGYLTLVGAAIEQAAADGAAVVVLAQASMAPAADHRNPTWVAVPVLSSPRLGLRAAVRLVAGRT